MNISHAQGQEVQVTLLYDAAGTRTSLCVGSVSLSTKKKKRNFFFYVKKKKKIYSAGNVVLRGTLLLPSPRTQKRNNRIRSLPPQIFSHRLDPLKEKKNVAQRQRCVQIEQKGVASSSVT